MKWITCLNEDTPLFNTYRDLLKVAVVSCLENTQFQPIFIYDGKDNELTYWLEKKGVDIIHHKSSFTKAFLNYCHKEPDSLQNQIAHGAFLRVDIPSIAKKNNWQDEFVFYTDCDVMFLGKWPNRFWNNQCKFFAVAPEVDINNFDDFNTGSMIMNLEGLSKVEKNFNKYIIDNIDLFFNSAWDQTAYQKYFKKYYTKLNPIYNWKTYWGINSNAKLIHFHGIKPHHRMNISNGTLKEPFSGLVSKEFYYFTNIWDSYLKIA